MSASWVRGSVRCRSAGITWCSPLAQRWTASVARTSLLLLLALCLSSCERGGALLTQPQYSAALPGEWRGSVGGQTESIHFGADGSFRCQTQSSGFIGATLGQGAAGTLRGRWKLHDSTITLAVDQATGDEPLNLATTSTIVSFSQNQLLVKAASGEVATFDRVQ